MVQIVGNLEWELLKNVEIRKSIYARITNTRFVDRLLSEKWYFLVYDAVFRDFTKSYFISYQHNCIEQKRTYVIFLDIGEILEKTVHESSVCDTGVYRFTNFHIFKQFPFQIPYNLDHFFQFSITFNNSSLPFQFHYPSIFATCYPFPEIFTSAYIKKNHICSLLFNKIMFIWYEIGYL
jgi:hypothetical protein